MPFSKKGLQPVAANNQLTAIAYNQELALEERMALILLELSENFGRPERRGIRLTVPASHKDLAELVGASRPRVTEYLALLEERTQLDELCARSTKVCRYLPGFFSPPLPEKKAARN